MQTSNNTGTFEVTSGSVTIIAAMGLRRVSILMKSGTGSIRGSLSVEGLTSSTFTLAEGDARTIVSEEAIDGLVITADAGATIEILANRN